MFSGAGDGEGKCILNLLKAFNLRERKSVVVGVTAIKTRVNKRSDDSRGSGKLKSVMYTPLWKFDMSF